jgi:hypothetical protein
MASKIHGGTAIKSFLAIPDKYSAPMQRGLQRHTKIVSTLGPATDSAEMIGKLMDAGVNIFRLNMSHAPHDWVRRCCRHPRRIGQARAPHGHPDGHAGAGDPHRAT